MPAPNPTLRHAIRYRQACRVIDAHLSDCRFDVAALVAQTGLSRATLYRAFSEQGLGVRQAIRERRLIAARRLLVALTGTLTSEAVAYRCGFIETSSFRRAFQRYFGCTPQACRGQAALSREYRMQNWPG